MDRQIVYPGQIPLDTDILSAEKNALIGLAKLAGAVLGTGTIVNGLACVPTGPASLQVVVNPGEIYSLVGIDATGYGSLPIDTTHTIMKQGLLMDAVTLSCPAPITGGNSINYLVQAAYQDSDALPVVLPYFNASNPAQAFSGPNNTGSSQNTVRKGVCTVNVKAGVSAPTGSQTTPAADAGFTGLWVVTVANGQATIIAGNISKLAGAPFLANNLTTITPLTAAGDLLTFNGTSNVRLPVSATNRNVLVADSTQASGLNWMLPMLHGKCYLSKSGANLLLSPKEGNTLVINSAVQLVPDAGVTLGVGGLAASTTYFVYAFMNSGTMTLEAVATGHSTQAGTGVEIKTGDATRTLVGMGRTNGSTAWQDDSTLVGVLSYFNRRNKGVINQAGATGTSSLGATELSSAARFNFLVWADESVHVAGHGTVNNSSGATQSELFLSLDSTGGSDVRTFFNNGAVTGGGSLHIPWASGWHKSGLSEGFHFITITELVSGGSATNTINTLSGTTRG
jgi:hypothetical protein